MNVNAIIKRFAPMVWFHSGDHYLPSNVPWFLRRVKMGFYRGLLKNSLAVLNKGQVTIINLSQQKREERSSGSISRSNFFLQIPDDQYETVTRRGYLPSATCYAHVQPVKNQSCWDLVYLFFYPYNAKISNFGNFAHEGDWEHIRVRVDAAGENILKIYYAAHDKEGRWCKHKSVDPVNGYSTRGKHPIVYSAKHSHASYPSAGKQNRRKSRPDDHTERGKGPWRTWEKVVDVGDRLHPLNGQEWLRYSGRWGKFGKLSFTSGPIGPAYKKWWLANKFHKPVSAEGYLVFYQKNGCDGNVQETTDKKNQVINVKNRKHWKNDFYRSLKLVNVRKGTIIRLFDDPKGGKGDDWTQVTVKRQVRKIKINSFERNRDTQNVRIVYHKKNGLDGKLSRIEIA